jgi:hypothetical protein
MEDAKKRAWVEYALKTIQRGTEGVAIPAELLAAIQTPTEAAARITRLGAAVLAQTEPPDVRAAALALQEQINHLAAGPFVQPRTLRSLLEEAYDEQLRNPTEQAPPATPLKPATRTEDDPNAIANALARGDRKSAALLWMEARKKKGLTGTKTALYQAASQDKSEYYKWERLELRDGCQADRDIKAVLLKPIL